MFQDISSQFTLPVVISLTAFVISNISAVIAYKSAKRERQRSIRTQITDVLGRIVANQLANAKLRFETENQMQLQYLGSIYGQQNAFLLDQVKYLTDQVPELVTTVEYNTLGVVNVDAGNLIEAEHYFVKAIEIARNTVQTSLATNSYSQFLFQFERPEEARRQVEKAIAMMKGNDDISHSNRGICYQQWAASEMQMGQPAPRIQELFDLAYFEFNSIHNRYRAQMLLGILNGIRNQANPQTAGPSQPVGKMYPNALSQYMSAVADATELDTPPLVPPAV